MATTQAKTKLGLGDMPPEIFLQLLEASTDPWTLRNLALTSKTFFGLLKGAEERIATIIMKRYIDPSVHHDAAIAVRAVRLFPDDPATNQNDGFWEGVFEPPGMSTSPLSSFRRTPDGEGDAQETAQAEATIEAIAEAQAEAPSSPPPPVTWSLGDAMIAARLHPHVTWLTGRLFDELLKRIPYVDVMGKETTADWPPTQTEINRLQRALYRFQTLCELFRRHQKGDTKSSLDSWLRKSSQLAAPQMEQLCIVNDLLMALVAKAFNDVALHDITWGYYRVSLISSETNRQGQYIVSRGLKHVASLLAARTFNERRSALGFFKKPGKPNEHVPENANDFPPPQALDSFLVDRFTRLTPTAFFDPATFLNGLTQMTPARRRELRNPAFQPDLDPGPAALWEWVHLDSHGPIGIYMVHQHRHYRQWGYLLWDQHRLDRMAAFRRGWDPFTDAAPDLFAPYWEFDLVSLELTWHRRRQLFKEGKRGYWEPGNEDLGDFPGEVPSPLKKGKNPLAPLPRPPRATSSQEPGRAKRRKRRTAGGTSSSAQQPPVPGQQGSSSREPTSPSVEQGSSSGEQSESSAQQLPTPGPRASSSREQTNFSGDQRNSAQQVNPPGE